MKCHQEAARLVTGNHDINATTGTDVGCTFKGVTGCCFSPFNLKVSHGTQQQMLARQSQRCSRDCSGVWVVASLEGARGLLSRFDCVYSDYITQGCPGAALAVAMSLRARCFFFPYTHPTVDQDSRGPNCPSYESVLSLFQVLMHCR